MTYSTIIKQVSFTVMLFFGLALNSHAQLKVDSSKKYQAVVSFTSMCCGTAESTFLKNFVKKFNRQKQVKVKSFKLSGCGREGEYNILFSTSQLSKKNKAKFITDLNKLLEKENLAIKAAGKNKGPVNAQYDLSLAEINQCRGQLEQW